MNDLIVVPQQNQWLRLKSLVRDSVSSPITKPVYNLGLGEFFAWYGLEPSAGFTKATVSAWRVALEAPAATRFQDLHCRRRWSAKMASPSCRDRRRARNRIPRLPSHGGETVPGRRWRVGAAYGSNVGIPERQTRKKSGRIDNLWSWRSSCVDGPTASSPS